ncbi:MAG: hypothetical protein Q8K90_07565, partial [Brevundimonas sp.]|nr:hypothetical protein [Brevundimonas sp.]
MSEQATPQDVVRFEIDRGLVRGVAVALAGGALLALSGAFGMGDTALGFRLAYWMPVMLVGAMWGHLCSRLVEGRIDMDRRPWLAIAALTLVISGPLAVMV